MERIRIRYAKTAPLRYTGNLDVHKVWERTLRRARLPLAYSQGFHPQPRLNQACPLPLGITSRAEVIDVWLKEDVPLEQVRNALEKALPPGIELVGIKPVELNAPSLPTQVLAAAYQATLLEEIPADELQRRVDALLAAESLPRKRREKTYDLRPLVKELYLLPPAGGALRLAMRLSARENATGRADEVLDQLGIPRAGARIERTHLFFLDEIEVK